MQQFDDPPHCEGRTQPRNKGKLCDEMSYMVCIRSASQLYAKRAISLLQAMSNYQHLRTSIGEQAPPLGAPTGIEMHVRW
jgi:hypothetical protein